MCGRAGEGGRLADVEVNQVQLRFRESNSRLQAMLICASAFLE